LKYVFDSGPFIASINYYPSIFKKFWLGINQLVNEKNIISVREVFRKITRLQNTLSEWAKQNEEIFEEPLKEEFEIVKSILKNHKELIENRKITGGLPVADPFIIAKAKTNNLIVVTQELYKENAHKIPNICREIDVKYMTLEEFMINEGWEF